MLDTRFRLICKPLHRHVIDWKETHFVPNVQNYIDLLNRQTNRKNYEIAQ